MNLVERAKLALGILFNRYEAAQPSSPKRSWIPGFMRDAKIDANSWSRWEMTRKIRYFERNVWLVSANRDTHVKWTVGANGLGVVPASSDVEWNKAMLESYEEWCEKPCIDSTIPMRQVHRQIAGTCHLENDMFVHKTRIKNNCEPTKPAIQLIESHRCSIPGQAYSTKDDPEKIDGVEMGKDEFGRNVGPVGYWILDDELMTQWAYRSVNEMHHIFSPERIGMFRGITQYHSVMNTLHDLDDLEGFAMERAKNISEVSYVLTSPSGEINRDIRRAKKFGFGLGESSLPLDPKEDEMAQRMSLYRKVLGARVMALKTGEKMEQHALESPSVAEQWFWRYKIGQVSKAAGIPLALIFPELIETINGTIVRGIYDDAYETFRGYFFLYAAAAINIYRFWANWARYNDPRCVDAPADWKKCHVVPPRAVNVDIGYTSAATLAELEAGITNWDDIAGRYGTTAEVLIRKKAKNVAMIHAIAIEEGVDPAEISAPIADIIQKLAAAEAMEQSGQASDPSEGVKTKSKPRTKPALAKP